MSISEPLRGKKRGQTKLLLLIIAGQLRMFHTLTVLFFSEAGYNFRSPSSAVLTQIIPGCELREKFQRTVKAVTYTVLVHFHFRTR